MKRSDKMRLRNSRSKLGNSSGSTGKLISNNSVKLSSSNEWRSNNSSVKLSSNNSNSEWRSSSNNNSV